MTSPMSTTIPRSRRRCGGWPPTRRPSRSRDWSCGIWRRDWTGRRSRRCRQGWANRYELTLAKDFVEHLDASAEGETGRVLFEVDGTDAASEALAVELRTALRRKMVLGLVAEVGIPARPEGPAVACRVEMTASEAQVQVTSSDATRENWVSFGKFTLPVVEDQGKFDAGAIRRWVGRGGSQSAGAGAVEQGRQGQGKDALPASN